MGDTSIKARLVMQQCLSARLQVQPPLEDKDAQFVQVRKTIKRY